MEDITGCSSAKDFQSLDDADKRCFVAEMIDVGLSIRQISRISGMTIGKVEAVRAACENSVQHIELSPVLDVDTKPYQALSPTRNPSFDAVQKVKRLLV